jgi:hypothetical protein
MLPLKLLDSLQGQTLGLLDQIITRSLGVYDGQVKIMLGSTLGTVLGSLCEIGPGEPQEWELSE